MNIIKIAMNIIKMSLNIMDILFFFLQAILAVGTQYYAPKHYYTPYQFYKFYMTARIKNKNIYYQSSRTLFYCTCANELVVNNGNRGEIMEKLRGELWEGRAVDGKLKSSLEWPYCTQ